MERSKNSKLGVVIKEVYRKNVKTGAFIFMVLFPIILLGIMTLITKVTAREVANMNIGRVAVIDADEKVKEAFKNQLTGMAFTFDVSKEEGIKLLEEKKVDGYLILNKNQDKFNPEFHTLTDSKDVNTASMKNVLQSLQFQTLTEKYGITKEAASEITGNNVDIATIKSRTLSDGTVEQIDSRNPITTLKQILAYGASILMIMFISTYIGVISQEIASEKGSRIMEIILSSINATTHFIGKMVGVFLIIVTQVLVYVLLYFVGKNLLKDFDLGSFLGLGDINIGALLKQTGSMMTYTIIFALLGVLIYTVLAGFLGSLVSKTEDVSKMILPVTMTALCGFYIGMFAFVSSNNAFVRFTSQIPLFTPFIMPFRMAQGSVTQFEIILSIILSILFAIVCLFISAKFYKTNVLTYSDKGIIYNIKRSFELMKNENSQMKKRGN